MLREERKSVFRTVTVGGVVLGLFALPLRRRLERNEPRVLPKTSERTLLSPSQSLDQTFQSSYSTRRMYHSVQFVARHGRFSTYPWISETFAIFQMMPLVFGFFRLSSSNRSWGDCGSIERCSCSRA